MTTDSSSAVGAVGPDGSAGSALLSPARPCRGLLRTFSWAPPILASRTPCLDEQADLKSQSRSGGHPLTPDGPPHATAQCGPQLLLAAPPWTLSAPG